MSRTAKLLLIPVAVAIAVVPAFLIAKGVGTGGLVAIGAGGAWFLASGALLLYFTRGWPELRMPLIVTLLLTAAVVGFLIRPKESEVDERIVSGAPAAEPKARGNVQVARGTFKGVSGHSGTGSAAVIELPGGARRLTFRRFDVDPGAGTLRVYLAAGDPESDGEVDDFKDLAKLKGTKGDQQYVLPSRLDLEKYDSVVIWCVPFTTRIAQARLN